MRTWLRGRFAWRFSLRRLVIAVAVLGTVIGLNVRRVGPIPGWLNVENDLVTYSFRGWPLCFSRVTEPMKEEDACRIFGIDGDDYRYILGDLERRLEFVDRRVPWPWTHETYRLASLIPMRFRTHTVCGVIDAIIGLVLPFLILCLQIPRLPAPVPAAPDRPTGPQRRPRRSPPARS